MRSMIFLIGGALAASVAAQDAPGEPVMLEGIVAVVNDGVVLRSELDERIEQVIDRLALETVPVPPREVLEQQVLERLVVEEIQLQRAQRLGIVADDANLNRALTRIAQRASVSLSELPQVLEAQGIDYAKFREQTRREMLLEQLRARDVMGRIQISPSEVDAYMAKQAEENQNVEYRVSHILIPIKSNSSSEEIDAVRQRAEELRERLAAGEDFGRLAVSYSSGPQALEGGDLGWRKMSELPTLFVDVLDRLEPGQVSRPIRSPSGFHIIKLFDQRGVDTIVVTQRHARHLLIETNAVTSDQEALDKIRTLRERIEGGESFAEVARQVSDDIESRAEGGDLGWSNPGTFPPEMEDALAELEPGELSQPVRTDFGWHLIELIDVRKRDSTRDLRRNVVYGQLQQQKLEEETVRWIRQLRDEAYVEYRL